MTEREGEELEPREEESRWDHPAWLGLGILAFWTVFLGLVIGIEIALGVKFR